MPNCKNGKVVLSRFKAQSLIRSKYRFDFHRKYVFEGYLEELIIPYNLLKSFRQDYFLQMEI